MNLNKLNSGQDVPNNINVLIEISAQGGPVKYEVDKESESLFVDRFLGTSMVYPTNYGYVPKTLSEDGDPVDVLVLTPAPVVAGSVIRSRPIGMLKMADEKGEDAKILAVPIDKLCSIYRDLNSPDDVAPDLIASITHFFKHYKDLEKGKWVKIEGWVGADEAKAEILASIDRYKE